jgi:glutamate-ammonia-ligase adenylyltransferase
VTSAPPPPVERRVAVRLARLSFRDAERAGALLSAPPLGWWDPALNRPTSDDAAVALAALSRTADPDAALAALADLAIRAPDVRAALEREPALRARLLALLGCSSELSHHLAEHPEDWRVLADDLDAAGAAARIAASVGADPADPVTGTGGTRARVRGPAAVMALRRAYRREVVAVAGRDLAGDLDLRAVTELLADLAGHVLGAALAIAAADLPPDAAPCRLAVIAMGKTGARELNYISDVDVVFVAEPDGPVDGTGTELTATEPTATEPTATEPTATEVTATEDALATATRLARDAMRLCHTVAWQVDANLRPEGKHGPLVRTLASHESYYGRWASTWEFQALLKARPIAGDPALGERYVAAVSPLVWSAAERPNFVADVRAMRRRVVEHIPASHVERDIKLAPGGLRDVEFAVQLLQLVHGRADESLRVRATLPALDALRDGGYVGRHDAVSLIDAYRFLRTVEHRVQLRRLRRTHLLPDDTDGLAWLARAMGYRPDHRGDAAAVFRAEWELHAREVRRLHEKLFYRPLLEAVARVPTEGLRLTTDEARRRLAALGFADPPAALRHIEALTAGVSRRAALQRTLLPALLADFADAPDPDGGLLAYRRLSEDLGRTPWYLRLLRDGDAVAPRLAAVLGTSRYVARMLGRTPEALRLLGSLPDLAPRERAELAATAREVAQRRLDAGGDPAGDAVAAVAAVRGVRRHELLRTAFADLLVQQEVERTCAALTAGVDIALEVSLQVAVRRVTAAFSVDELPLRFAVIAMGRLGGEEVGYGSDADVMFCYEPIPGHAGGDEQAAAIARELARTVTALLAAPSSTDPPLQVDADLRPEGRSGALARSLASYERYYARWSSAWEAQALLRARPVAGDADLGRRFTAMIDPVRYPVGGIPPQDLLEIRRLKGRVDSERLPRGADPSTHTKLGRGGLADIEWTVQLLQLSHGAEVEGLRTSRTLPAIAAAQQAGLLAADQAQRLAEAWRIATRVRNAITLVRDKPGDQLPVSGMDLAAIARVLGHPADADPGIVVDEYRRAARRARAVVEAVFYGS